MLPDRDIPDDPHRGGLVEQRCHLERHVPRERAIACFLTGGRIPFLRFEEGWGHPDGMTVDSDGYLWVCHWGGSRISRFAPDGTVLSGPATSPLSGGVDRA